MGRIYVDKYTARIERSDLYLVRLILKDGTVLEPLEPRRLFPFSNPDMYITLLDDKEKEIGFVRDLEEIDKDSRRALEECFAEYYMIPEITRVIESVDRFGSLTWTVDTNRGRVTFQIRNRHSDIKELGNTGRIIVRDANDNRYEIKDYNALDAHSKHLLFSYL